MDNLLITYTWGWEEEGGRVEKWEGGGEGGREKKGSEGIKGGGCSLHTA